jgi:excisionase family DNA binding protein
MANETMTPAEAAEYLRLGVETVKRKARAGELPASKTGRKWLFLRSELDAWLKAGGTRHEAIVDRGLTAVAEQRAKDARWVSEDEVAEKLDV